MLRDRVIGSKIKIFVMSMLYRDKKCVPKTDDI